MGHDRAGTGGIGPRRRVLTFLLLTLLTAACAQGPRTVTGVVVAVDGDLTTVHSFTVHTDDGPLTFVPDPQGSFSFPLPHLGAHLRSGEAIRVSYEDREGILVAVGVEDAVGAKPLRTP